MSNESNDLKKTFRTWTQPVLTMLIFHLNSRKRSIRVLILTEIP
uniref:Truncated aquaporin n=1 Tax=Saccharomyces cerevisiae TaxID=4932 RepID=D3W8N8_YEASX|nr:truncated aquaporin [Saccharomyces cerevisiae]ADC55257.1 truncated aquaporin [Saccharomyces cerevisiae]ADC55262.1 truncated aquaporin [Saccharomyces cerevisiae]